MSIRHLLTAAAATATGYEIGAGRTVPTIALGVGLVSVVLGGLALTRRTRFGRGRGGTIAAAALGLIGVVAGGLHWANSAGGLGTGNGLAGAVGAVALGVIGVVLGGLALARARHAS